jgi:Phosphotransferase enzyme family.
MRVPVAGGVVWFKACSEVQAFEPRLTAELSSRWPGRVADVLAHDAERRWLLMADAGTAIAASGNAPEIWLRALPLYAELQRGEVEHAAEHLLNGVPDLRITTLPARYEQLARRRDLPINVAEVDVLRRFERRFADLCDELVTEDPRASIQHDDLHLWNLYIRGSELRVIDWGDASIAHPFTSLFVTFRFLEDVNGLSPTDPWFARLRDAYLEPWGTGLTDTFAQVLRVGTFAHAMASVRQRDALPEDARSEFDLDYAAILRRALAQTTEQETFRWRSGC